MRSKLKNLGVACLMKMSLEEVLAAEVLESWLCNPKSCDAMPRFIILKLLLYFIWF